MVQETSVSFVYRTAVSGPKARTAANATIFALPAYIDSRASRNPDIILGVTVAFAVVTTLLIVVVGVAFRVFLCQRTTQLLVMEREKYVVCGRVVYGNQQQFC